MRQKVSENYTNLKDLLVYSQLYGLNYPDEDCTNLGKEYAKIIELHEWLCAAVRSEYKKQQLRLAREKIDEAFSLYRSGMDAFRVLEGALEDVDRSMRDKAPRPHFTVGPDGRARSD